MFPPSWRIKLTITTSKWERQEGPPHWPRTPLSFLPPILLKGILVIASFPTLQEKGRKEGRGKGGRGKRERKRERERKRKERRPFLLLSSWYSFSTLLFHLEKSSIAHSPWNLKFPNSHSTFSWGSKYCWEGLGTELSGLIIHRILPHLQCQIIITRVS